MNVLIQRLPTSVLSRYAKATYPVISQVCAHSSDKPTDNKEVTSEGCGTTKLRRAKTPIGKLDELEEGKHPFQEKEPLKPWPNATNPFTGEVGGPKGPEPTRFGDWERKGRVSDF